MSRTALGFTAHITSSLEFLCHSVHFTTMKRAITLV
jgi:hypothetical protein